MPDNSRISSRQYTILVTMYMISSAILFIPGSLAEYAKQDAWLAAIIAVGTGALLVPLLAALGNRFPHMTLSEYCVELLGKWPGKALFLVFYIFTFLTTCLSLSDLGNFLNTEMLPETPIQSIDILFMVVIIWAVKLGLEPIARAAELFFPIVFVLFLMLIIFLVPKMDFKHLQPVLEGGIKPVIHASIPFISFPLLESFILLSLFPHVNREGNRGRALLVGVLLSGFILTVITTTSLLVIGADITTRSVFPSYLIAKTISIGHFLERIEALLAVIWFLTIFFTMSIQVYVLSAGMSQLLNLKEFRSLTLPLGMIIITSSLIMAPNSTFIIDIGQNAWAVFVPSVCLTLPVFLLIVAVIRKKRLP